MIRIAEGDFEQVVFRIGMLLDTHRRFVGKLDADRCLERIHARSSLDANRLKRRCADLKPVTRGNEQFLGHAIAIHNRITCGWKHRDSQLAICPAEICVLARDRDIPRNRPAGLRSPTDADDFPVVDNVLYSLRRIWAGDTDLKR